MIDLNNTWCEATGENREALKKLNIKLVGIGDYRKYLYIDTNGGYLLSTDTIKKEWKQIHLVNGEFQYVETKPKNNFKDYGFEADFEGEILRKIIGRGVDDGIATDRLIGFLKDEYGIIKIAEWWDDGILRNTCKLDEKYNLIPIKKEWYENADNVGKLIVYDYFDDNRIGIFKCLYKDKGWIELYTLNGCKVDQKTHKVRPATEEEILALLVKE